MNDDATLILLNALDSAVFLLDEQVKIRFANEFALKRFSVQLNADFVRTVRDPVCAELIEQAINGAGNVSGIISFGGPLPSIYRVKVLQLPATVKGAILAITMSDETSLKDAATMRSEFVANVSHELRSPLTAIAGFIETLQGPAKDDPDARERFLGVMGREANRMIRLIGDLLSLSKLQEKERVKPSGKANLDHIVRRVLDALRIEAQRDNRGFELFIEDADFQVEGDEDELTQVVQNLTENAVKYGKKDTTIKVELLRLQKESGIRGRVVTLKIADQGDGISPEDIPRLTERFYRVDKSRSRDKGGTGLGLAIVKHILNRHRGKLTIDSKLGKGSTFSVYIPIKQS